MSAEPAAFAAFEAEARAAGCDEVLTRDLPHAERYGADGATVGMARQHVA